MEIALFAAAILLPWVAIPFEGAFFFSTVAVICAVARVHG